MSDRHAREVLLLFLRYPRPGQVKTRLIPALGAQGAADLYRDLAQKTLDLARQIDRPCFSRWACIEPAQALADAADWIGPGFDLIPQAGDDLGIRMNAAFQRAFSQGAERVVIVGSDCPNLEAQQIHDAFDTLRVHDAAIGPAVDGGYYLLGLSRPLPTVFQGVPWSDPQTGQRTLERLDQARCWVHHLKMLRDVDTEEDLLDLKRNSA